MKTYGHLIIFSILFYFLIGCTNEVEQKISQIESEIESDSLKNITRLEKFLSKTGTLYIKDFYKVGTIKSNSKIKGTIDISGLVIYNPGEEEKRIKGLKVEIKQTNYSGYSSREEEETVFLDMDELKSLSEAIQYMIDLLNKWESTPKEYTEVIYSTIGKFKLGFFKQSKEKKIDEVWGFAQAGYREVTCYFKPDLKEQFKLIKDKIDEGIKLLNTK